MEYRFLGPKLGSYYRQWAVQGRGIFAQTLWLATLGEDGMTPEQVAAEATIVRCFACVPIDKDDAQGFRVAVNFLNHSTVDFDDERLHDNHLSDSE